jgi:hypothetical protein
MNYLVSQVNNDAELVSGTDRVARSTPDRLGSLRKRDHEFLHVFAGRFGAR